MRIVAAMPMSKPKPSGATGILVVDDHELVRLGFRALLHSHAPATARPEVTEAHSLAEALHLYAQQRADIAVVVLDLNLPDSKGLAGLIRFRQHFPEAAVVVLSGSDDPATVQGALALGVLSFFTKSGALDDIAAFIQACLQGLPADNNPPPEPPSWPAFASVSHMAGGNAFTAAHAPALSARQLQILQWLLEGKSNREISESACLSEGTVKNHVSTLLLSFGVRSRAQLISKLRA